MQNKRFGAFSSSEDPNKLADTVKGIILGLSSLIIFAAHKAGVEIGTEEISIFASSVGVGLSALWTIYGLIKKVIVKVADR